MEVGKCVGMTRAHVGSIFCMKIMESGRLVASFGRDNFGKLWCLDRFDSPRHVVGDVKLPQTVIDVNRDINKPEVFYIASDKAIHIWDIRVGGISAVLSAPFSASSLRDKRRITCMRVLSNGSILTGNSDGSLLYWPECGPWNGIEILPPSYLSMSSIANDSYKFLLGLEDGSVKLINNPFEFCKVDEERLLTKFADPIQKLDLIEENRVIVTERSGRVSALDFSIDNEDLVRGERMDSFLKWLNTHPICKPYDVRNRATLSGKFWS
ncbi:hypothetical protein GpartN1_g3636.t1 [Galdieria partita]|uniref:Uncharacterized protein n=1 Tax=Galdieria partita TaxID=83374 RepID=A0A9C7UQQ2_9RHOD|nr:hypothetical protein GpartN1_g3636.t1 [Galdieria partita]